MITVYTLTYNEEILIQFMIDHYRERFPGCHIVVYDNSSTDNTVNIAKKNGCEIQKYNSGGTLDDILHMRIKNSCWKNAKTDWVLVCDLDELLDINEVQLKKESVKNTTIIKAEGWQMVNVEDHMDPYRMKNGYRDPNETAYDKCMLFNKKYIQEINYSPGAHGCKPQGIVKYGNTYKMYHYKFIHPDLEVKKKIETASRLSENNKRHGCGLQCLMSEEAIRADYSGRTNCGKIRD